MRKEITVTINNREGTLDVYAKTYYDPCYGADADGNRGIGCWFIDDITWDTPEADDNGNLLNEEEKKKLNELINAKTDDIDF